MCLWQEHHLLLRNSGAPEVAWDGNPMVEKVEAGLVEIRHFLGSTPYIQLSKDAGWLSIPAIVLNHVVQFNYEFAFLVFLASLEGLFL